MSNLYAYVQFQGNCRDAMTFYKECLGGELQIMTIGESQMAEHMPAEAQNNVMHSALMKDGKIIVMGADSMGEEVPQSKGISLCIVGESKEELESLFAKVSQGATVHHPLKEEFFGTYGDLTDKFGVNWMFQYSPMP